MLETGILIGGRYRLVRQIGEGGMGVVWAAKNEAIDRDVAIKVMLPWLAKEPQLLQRFFNEARICGSIRDPGIVDVLDLGNAEDGSPFIVMELLNGEPLEALLRRERRLLPAAILPIVRDVAATLSLAHEKGVVHRDLKPANVFLHRPRRGQPVVKILDFGISKVIAGASATATRTGSVLGSPAYMSPEQAAGKHVDLQTDIYALGVILYEALSGYLPFDADNTNALIVAIATTSPPPLRQVAPDVPAPVAELVAHCMAHDREQRPQTANALADRLEATLSTLSHPRAMGASGAVLDRDAGAVSAAPTVASARAPAPAGTYPLDVAYQATEAKGVPAAREPAVVASAGQQQGPHAPAAPAAWKPGSSTAAPTFAATAAPISQTLHGKDKRRRVPSAVFFAGVATLALGATVAAFFLFSGVGGSEAEKVNAEPSAVPASPVEPAIGTGAAVVVAPSEPSAAPPASSAASAPGANPPAVATPVTSPPLPKTASGTATGKGQPAPATGTATPIKTVKPKASGRTWGFD